MVSLLIRGCVGEALIERHWVLYIFGVFLILTAAKMILVRHESDPRAPFVRFSKRFLPVTDHFVGEQFTVLIAD